MENELLTKELLERYRRHPRILEVRFILLFDMFEKVDSDEDDDDGEDDKPTRRGFFWRKK